MSRDFRASRAKAKAERLKANRVPREHPATAAKREREQAEWKEAKGKMERAFGPILTVKPTSEGGNQ